MRLVIDTALAAQSLALLDDDNVVTASHTVIGRGHAETLMPALAALLEGRDPPVEILVDIGPGSFTGLRIGIAAARALGLAWGVPVNGYASLALIVAPVFAAHPEVREIATVAEAGRGQLYVQRLDRAFHPVAEFTALDAEALASWLPRGTALAGPGAARVPGAHVLSEAWPDARDAWLLPVAARSLAPSPHYVRPPDAVAA